MNEAIEKFKEMRFLERQIQNEKVAKKKQLKEIAKRNGLSYKSVKKIDVKIRREAKVWTK